MNRIKRALSGLIMRRKLMAVLALALLGCGAAAIFSARAYNSPPPAVSATAQGGGRSRSRLHSRLNFQPEANRFRHRLGQRFISAGRDVSSMTGTLTINGQASPVTIIRRQDDDGEQVTISIAGGPALNWNGRDGARVAGGAAKPDRGVRPNGTYSVSDIEAINLTNGNLSLSIPLQDCRLSRAGNSRGLSAPATAARCGM